MNATHGPRRQGAPLASKPTAPFRQNLSLALAAVMALNLPLGTVYAYSVFIRPFEAALGASRAQLSFVFGLTLVCFTLGMNLGPLLYRRAPTAMLLGGSAAVAALGIALAALAEDVPQLALGYGVLFGLGGGIAYVVLLSCTRFLWTPICPRGDRNDDVQHEEDRSSFSR